MEAGDPAAAAEAYRAALDESPGDPRVIGRLRAAEEALAGARVEEAREALAAGDPVAAWQEARAVQALLPGWPEARALEEDAEAALLTRTDELVGREAWAEALRLVDRANAVSMQPEGWTTRRERIRAEGGRAVCAEAERWQGEGESGNALLALQRAQALGAPCGAPERLKAVRDGLKAGLILALSLDLEGEVPPGLSAPLGRWVAEAGIPLRVTEPGPRADLHLEGHLEVDTEREQADRTLTVERQVDVRRVANPEYGEMARQAKQLTSELENARMAVWNAQRDVDQLYRAYLRTGSQQLREALYAANRRVEEARERYLQLAASYESVLRRMQTIDQLVEKPVMEQAEVQATEVRVGAESTGSAILTADWIEAPLRFSLDYRVQAADVAWERLEDRDVPANELVVPENAQLVDRLATQLGERILDQVQEAVRARAEQLVAEGDRAREAGREVDAVESYVRALLLDPEGERPAVRSWLVAARGASLPRPANQAVARQDDAAGATPADPR